jgi:hypothetical protein
MHLPDDHMRYAIIWFSLADLSPTVSSASRANRSPSAVHNLRGLLVVRVRIQLIVGAGSACTNSSRICSGVIVLSQK